MKESVPTFSEGGGIYNLTPLYLSSPPLALTTTHTTSVFLKLKAQVIIKLNRAYKETLVEKTF